MSALVRAVRLRNAVGAGIRALCSEPGKPLVPRYADQCVDTFEDRKEKLKAVFEGGEHIKDILSLPAQADVLIIGGGVVGSSIAYWLRRKVEKGCSVVILEKDPTYQRCATTRSAGGIRQQFSLEENIRLSMFGAEFLANYKEYLGDDAPDIQFNPEGYLFMASTDEEAKQMEENFKLQRQLGARVRLYSSDMLKRQFPFLNVDDVKLASYGLQNEGWFDPWSLLQGLKQSNLRNSIGYLKAELVDFRFKHVVRDHYHDGYTVNEAIYRLPDGTLRSMDFCMVVVAAGAESGHVGRILRMGEGEEILSVPIPVEPRKRSVYSFHAPDAPIVGFPFLIDPTGTYARREGLGGHFICGKSPAPEDDDPQDLDIDNVDDKYFNEVIWPTLAKRAPVFENIKAKHSWSGCYDYNYLDENAIIGKHPYYHNVFICTGFSGHGLQMAPGAGRAMMELMLEQSFLSIDLSRFSFDRVIAGETIQERGIV